MKLLSTWRDYLANGRIRVDLGQGVVLDTGALLDEAKAHADGKDWRRGKLAANQDWDALTTPGHYENAPWAVSSTQVNSASKFTGSVWVLPQGQYLTQMQITQATATGAPADVLWRSQIVVDGATVWSPWKSHLTEAKTYAVTQATSVRDEVKAYTDQQVAAGGPAFSDLSVTVAAGDSLTDGGSNGTLWPEPDTWVYKLDEALATTVKNYGYSGATVDEMLMRVGAIDVFFSAPNNTLTLGGATKLTTLRKLGLYPGRRMPITGKIAGRTGILAYETDGTWTFTNYDTTGTLALNGPTVFVPEWAGSEGASWVVMIGRNDVTGGVTGNEVTVADHVVAGVQQLIDWLAPRAPRVMLAGVTTRTNETAGSANHTTVTEINDRLRAMYPGKFRSIQAFLTDPATLSKAGITPTEADNAALQGGTIPPSLMDTGDNTHFSKATATLLANEFFKPYMVARGWR